MFVLPNAHLACFVCVVTTVNIVIARASVAEDSMAKLCLLVAVLLVAEVSSQSYPRLELRGDVLVNNSFILRGEPVNIGEGHSDSLHCVTDNSECCSNGQGDWYDERGRQVHQGPDGEGDLYVTRGDGVVYLNRRRGGSSGIWRCDIPDSNGVQQSIYIYLGTPYTGSYLLFFKVTHFLKYKRIKEQVN